MAKTWWSRIPLGRKLLNWLRLKKVRADVNHIVVLGGSPLMLSLQQQRPDVNRRVLLVSPSVAHQRLAIEASVAYLARSPYDEASLDEAGIGAASAVWCVGSSDTENIKTAEAVERILVRAREIGSGPIRLFVEVNDPQKRVELEPFIERIRAQKIAMLRVFSSTQIAVRRLFNELPPESFILAGTRLKRVVWICGFGALGEEVLLQVMRDDFHRSSDDRHRIVIVDREAGTRLAIFRQRWLGLEQVAVIRPVDAEVTRVSEFVPNLLREELHPTAIFMCFGQQSENINGAARIADELSVRSISVPYVRVRLLCSPSVDEIRNLGDCPWLKPFLVGDLVAEELQAAGDGKWAADEMQRNAGELFLHERLDSFAKTIHEHYVAAAAKRGEQIGQRRSLLHWILLPEDLKDDNRHVADHHFATLRDLGCRVHENKATSSFQLTAAEIERLAKMEHDRWWGERRLRNWRYAPQRDDAKLQHPDMVEYALLSEERKELDRNIVREIPKLLAQAGFRIVRYLSVAATGSASTLQLGPAFDRAVIELMEGLTAGPRCPFIWADLRCAMACRAAEISRDRLHFPYGVIVPKFDADNARTLIKERADLIRHAQRAIGYSSGNADDGLHCYPEAIEARVVFVESGKTADVESSMRGTWVMDNNGELLVTPN